MAETKQTFKVTGLYKENKRSYFTINYKGDEYFVPMLPYQMVRGGYPPSINCMVKEEKGQVKITQDFSCVIRELYKVNEVYTFTVKFKHQAYYSVCDTNNLLFRLTEFDRKELVPGQTVNARVISIDSVRMCLRLVDDRGVEEKIPFITVGQLGEKLALSDAQIADFRGLLDGSASLEAARKLYQAGDGLWILNALSTLDELLLGNDGLLDGAQKYIDIFQKLCIFALEGSVILRKIGAEERLRWIRLISAYAQHAEDYKEAYSIFDEGRTRDYLSLQLTNLKESENLYQPERKFRIMMCLLNLDGSLMPEMVDRLFDIILEGDKTHWTAEPFRTAFVDLLELFIQEYRFTATRVKGVDLIHQMIRAIAIQQLLSNGEDDIDRRLNRSTYYRLLAYIQRYSSHDILDDAFRSLFSPYDETLEYDWDDIPSLEALYIKAAYKTRVSRISAIQRQRSSNGFFEIVVDNGGVTLQSVTGYPRSLGVGHILPWQHLDIKVNNHPKKKCRDGSKVDAVARFWSEMETELWNRTPVHRKTSFDAGDSVTFRVIDENDSGDALYCEISSPELKAYGWLDIRETVPYLQPSPGIKKLFQDKNGRPLTLEACVIEGPNSDDEYEISMLDIVNDYFETVYGNGDEVTCTVRAEFVDRDDTHYYVGIAAGGASCLILKRDGLTLRKHDVARASILYRNSNGQYVCQYEGPSEESVSVMDVLGRLFTALSVEEEAQEEIVDDTMEVVALKEMIAILDRLSVIDSSRAQSYSYLSLAIILAKAIDDTFNIGYYDTRRKIIVATEEYERNKYVDDKKLSALLESIGDDLIQGDYLVNEAVTKFRILQSLRHKDNLPALFQISSTATNPSIKNAADLAIAMLLTARFELPNIGRLLQDRINQEIGVNVSVSSLRDFGFETQTQEFKTSVVFPPSNKMRPDPVVQGANIMRVICSFLNSDEGGRLYIGVNNNGASCGVDNDLKYLQTDEDGYGRYIHNMINRELGPIANQCCIDCTWDEDAGYKIYVMNIKPSPELIKYRNDYWIRQDTEKRILRPDKLSTYEKMHSVAYEKFIAGNPAAAATAPKEETPQPQEAAPSVEVVVASRRIPTSRWRRNVTEPWNEECGLDTQAFLHLLSNSKYKITDNGVYDDTELSLAIHVSEASGFILVGYESGKILVVNTEELLEKSRNRASARCQSEAPVFISPAHAGDGVLSVWRNTQGELSMRVDTYDELVEQHCDGSLSDYGRLVHDTKYREVVAYEIVPEDMMPDFQRYRKQGMGLGQKIKDRERDLLRHSLHLEI